ncbi:hypothetical protein [Clostridium sp.]|uniref:hypothetical protein n=1 Tax=Clostridium sp. TaxID=1506 RepID=UPI002615E670|nr:hypothetical protein [Clostridium sp.]
MENSDNLIDVKDDDLKFMPLKVNNPFTGNESNWFPLVNLDSPNINNFTNNFIFGFSTPMVSGKIDDNFYKNIGYPEDNQNYMNENESNMGYNPQGDNQLNPNNNMQGYNEPNMEYNLPSNNDANMGYKPQEYNQLNPNNNIQGYNKPNMEYNQECDNKTQNCNNLGVNYQQYPKEAYGEELISYDKGYIDNFNTKLELNRYEEEIKEDLPHMKILKEYSFLELAEEDLRDDNKEKINNIFSRIESGDDSILNIFKLYEIPYPMANMIVKKIINESLDYK